MFDNPNMHIQSLDTWIRAWLMLVPPKAGILNVTIRTLPNDTEVRASGIKEGVFNAIATSTARL